MIYRVQVCDPGGAWLPLTQCRDEAAACIAFDREVERAVRGVRVLDQDGHQVAAFHPGRAA